MKMELREATGEDRATAENLLQFYAYDFSELLEDAGTDEHGRFGSISLGAWPSAERRLFLARVGGLPAGFALVCKLSASAGRAGATDMQEFFVMRKYRHHGVGRAMATRLFDLFPGPWEVREVTPNVAAQAFWRRVIGDYTGGRFEERQRPDGRGPMQLFVSNGAAA